MREIEPTEEHLQAALSFYSRRRVTSSTRALARLLACREANLLEMLEMERFYRQQGAEERDALTAENAELRARIATLEAE